MVHFSLIAFPPLYFPLLSSSFLLGVFMWNKLLNSCSSLSAFTCALPQWDALLHPLICHVILIPTRLMFPLSHCKTRPTSALFSFYFSPPFLSCLLSFSFFPHSSWLCSPLSSSSCFSQSSSLSPLPNPCLHLNLPSQPSPSNNSVMVELVRRAPSYQLLWF